MSTQETPSAGWYPDPSGTPGQRWWNGTEWTDTTRPYPPPAPTVTAPDLPVLSPNRGTSYGQRYRETWVKTGVAVGLITTILILSSQADSYRNLSSDAAAVALLMDGAIGFVVNFLVWGSLVNLVVAAVRSAR